MMTIPGCLDAFKVAAAKLPVASLSIQLCAGFQYPIADPLEAHRFPGRFLPPTLAPNTRFHFFP